MTKLINDIFTEHLLGLSHKVGGKEKYMKNAVIQFLLPSNLKLTGSREYLVSSTASWLKHWLLLPHGKPGPKVAWIPTLVTKFRFHFLRITFLYLEMRKIIQNNHIWEFPKYLLTISAENLKIGVKNMWLSSNVFWMNDQSCWWCLGRVPGLCQRIRLHRRCSPYLKYKLFQSLQAKLKQVHCW